MKELHARPTAPPIDTGLLSIFRARRGPALMLTKILFALGGHSPYSVQGSLVAATEGPGSLSRKSATCRSRSLCRKNVRLFRHGADTERRYH